ncbi:MAG TPA: sugar phosphate isomerase/epimerase [Firmicutes bacterium]|nr:sugar phosphate isomerase/epimerase [Bacillota bacterium]
MAQKIVPSGHLLEMFMPYRDDEKRMLDVLKRAADFGFYKNVELPSFRDRYNRMYVRETLEANGLTATTFATPYVKERKLSLCDLDEGRRREAIELCKEHAGYAADCGFMHFGVPSGDDPGDEKRAEAKKVMAESLVELANYVKGLGMNLTIEPLDRYAYKKQLIGPMKETGIWFAPIHEACPNVFIHWDSAHEALGGTDLMHSIEYVAPYIGQFHLCDAITDVNHPCFGDLHMDVAQAPDWKTEGFLTPEIGAEILKKIASYDKPEGVKHMAVAVEVLGHAGDNLWNKEKNAREFLTRCFELAGM